jgi:bis(5'-nucleosyl)-tetraphosphatase (symmetrical)
MLTPWSDELKGAERLRVIVNAMTRMRFITRDGEIDLGQQERWRASANS